MTKSWNDPEGWSALCSGEACPICLRSEPLNVIAQLEAAWVTMAEDAPMRGYVCLVSRIHAVDLHDLPEEAALAFMRDARAVSEALAHITGAVKMNYEIHGNTLPHLHMHFFPRYRGDAFEGRPIDPRVVVEPVYAGGEFERTRSAFLAALRRNKHSSQCAPLPSFQQDSAVHSLDFRCICKGQRQAPF
jgi:diadenosine tetraphosphate (Ap4A) HIT family hydrolase